jgi:hypothetical protein
MIDLIINNGQAQEQSFEAAAETAEAEAEAGETLPTAVGVLFLVVERRHRPEPVVGAD